MLVEHACSAEPTRDILAARGGHVYLVYHTQQKIFASVSHDGGKTWSVHNLVGTD